MKFKILAMFLAEVAVATLPFAANAKLVKIYRVPATGRTILIDDEKVYSIKTSLGRHGYVRYDTRRDSFVDSRTKKPFVFRNDEWVTDVSSIDGIQPGGSIVAYMTLNIRKGTTIFGYPFDCKNGDNNLAVNLLRTAIDGDRITYQCAGTNYSFVAVFASQNNTLCWHKTESFEVCKELPIPDADTPFYYGRRQDISSDVIFFGARQLKSGNVIYFRDYGIDEAYRLFEQYGFEKDVDLTNNLLGGESNFSTEVIKLSVLTPKKFYVVLKSGHRAFGMFQPSIEVNRTIYSPITSAPLAVSPNDIACFEVIADDAFPQNECYSKNEVDSLYEQYLTNNEEGFFYRMLHQITGAFWDREHPYRSIIWWGFFSFIVLLILKKKFRQYLKRIFYIFFERMKKRMFTLREWHRTRMKNRG